MSIFCKPMQTIEKWYFTRKAKQVVRKAKRECRTPVYVHTMGKVGSSTVRKSLRSSEIADKLAVYGTYFLSKSGLSEFNRIEHAGFGEWCKYTKSVKYLLCEGAVLGDEVEKASRKKEKAKVITLVRDPISTNVSGFFQNYRWWPEPITKACRAGDPGCVGMLIRHFLEHYPHDVPLTWWDSELKGVFKVDVMESEFPKSLGYKIYDSDVADVLVIKLEKLNVCATNAFRELMGLDKFQMISKNTAMDKWFSEIYREFCNTIIFPECYLEKMYKSPLYTSFYSNEELAKFEHKWRR